MVFFLYYGVILKKNSKMKLFFVFIMNNLWHYDKILI